MKYVFALIGAELLIGNLVFAGLGHGLSNGAYAATNGLGILALIGAIVVYLVERMD